jgi:hypothetical protein
MNGAEMAAKDAYNQQLWDIYREYNDELDLPLIIEDRQKDIHEVLPEPAVQKLELKLKGMVASCTLSKHGLFNFC